MKKESPIKHIAEEKAPIENLPVGLERLRLDVRRSTDESLPNVKEMEMSDLSAGEMPIKESNKPKNPPSTTVWMGNLSYKVSEDEIRDFLGDYKVLKIRVIADKFSRQPEAIAYAEFADIESAQNAISNLDDASLAGRNVKLHFADA